MSFSKKNFPIRLLIAVLFSLHLTSCHYPIDIPTLPAIDNELVMRVVIPYALKLQQEKKLTLEDSSVEYGPGGTFIKKVMVTFSSQSIVELRQAREMLVDVVDGLVASFNEDEELGPMISSYPLSSDDMEICIKFESYLGYYVDKAYIHWMILQDKRSYFYAFDLTNEFHIWDRDCECWHERVEPFYKSRQIVTIQRETEKIFSEKKTKNDLLLSPDRYINNNRLDNSVPSL